MRARREKERVSSNWFVQSGRALGVYVTAGSQAFQVVPALLLASLVIPVCSATFPDVIGSSDSRLEQCFDMAFG